MKDKYLLTLITGDKRHIFFPYPTFKQALNHFEESYKIKLRLKWKISIYNHEDDYVFMKLIKDNEEMIYRIENNEW